MTSQEAIESDVNTDEPWREVGDMGGEPVRMSRYERYALRHQMTVCGSLGFEPGSTPGKYHGHSRCRCGDDPSIVPMGAMVSARLHTMSSATMDAWQRYGRMRNTQPDSPELPRLDRELRDMLRATPCGYRYEIMDSLPAIHRWRDGMPLLQAL